MIFWSDASQLLGTGDGYVEIDADGVTTDTIDLLTNSYDGVIISVEIDFGDSPYHDIVFYIQESIDGTVFEDDSDKKYVIPKDKSTYVIKLKRTPYCRIKILQSKSVNDDHLESYNARIYYRGWRKY